MNLRGLATYGIALFFAVAGIFHFTHTAQFAAIVPPMLPAPDVIVLVTGAVELVLSVLLLPLSTRTAAGRALALYAVGVLPANVTMALDPALHGGIPEPLLWLRVALQAPLIALIFWATRPARSPGERISR